jgi:hypothetical protein
MHSERCPGQFQVETEEPCVRVAAETRLDLFGLAGLKDGLAARHDQGFDLGKFRQRSDGIAIEAFDLVEENWRDAHGCSPLPPYD